jgi:hypothetical protein
VQGPGQNHHPTLAAAAAAASLAAAAAASLPAAGTAAAVGPSGLLAVAGLPQLLTLQSRLAAVRALRPALLLLLLQEPAVPSRLLLLQLVAVPPGPSQLSVRLLLLQVLAAVPPAAPSYLHVRLLLLLLLIAVPAVPCHLSPRILLQSPMRPGQEPHLKQQQQQQQQPLLPAPLPARPEHPCLPLLCLLLQTSPLLLLLHLVSSCRAPNQQVQHHSQELLGTQHHSFVRPLTQRQGAAVAAGPCRALLLLLLLRASQALQSPDHSPALLLLLLVVHCLVYAWDRLPLLLLEAGSQQVVGRVHQADALLPCLLLLLRGGAQVVAPNHLSACQAFACGGQVACPLDQVPSP